ARRRPVAGCLPDCRKLAHSARLHRPRRGGRLLPPHIERGCAYQGPAAHDAGPDPRADVRFDLLRHRYGTLGRRREPDRGGTDRGPQTRGGALMLALLPETLVLAALTIPLVGALLIP